MIKPPTEVRQLRHFLGMVQYYCDLWARRSNMLAPLNSLVRECGRTKSARSKGTKKVPWHWDKVHQRAFNHVKATIAAKDIALACTCSPKSKSLSLNIEQIFSVHPPVHPSVHASMRLPIGDSQLCFSRCDAVEDEGYLVPF